MTRDSDLKKHVRARMARTGENYTSARAALLAEQAVRPADREAAARAEHARLIRPFLRDGRLVGIPARRRARTAVMLEILARFAPGEVYDETQVGEVLEAVHEDVAFLRRELVDLGYLEREADGAAYRVAAQVPQRQGNMAQEITEWERTWLPRFIAGDASGAPAAPGGPGAPSGR